MSDDNSKTPLGFGSPPGSTFTDGDVEWHQQQMRCAAVNAGVAASMMMVGTGRLDPAAAGRYTRVMVGYYYGYIRDGEWPSESSLGVPREMDGILD